MLLQLEMTDCQPTAWSGHIDTAKPILVPFFFEVIYYWFNGGKSILKQLHLTRIHIIFQIKRYMFT